jgi:hypothetical protein
MRKPLLTTHDQSTDDPYYASVAFQLNMNRAIGTTVPIDDGPRRLSLSRLSNLGQYSDDVRLFGGTVWRQVNTSQGILGNVGNDWRARGGSSWCLDQWLYPTSLAADAVILDVNSGSTNNSGWLCYLGTDGKLYNWCGPNGVVIGGLGSGSVALNTWNFVRWVWNGRQMVYVINGIVQGSERSFTNIWPESVSTFTLGNSKFGTQGFIGYLGPSRFTTFFSRELDSTPGSRIILPGRQFPVRGLNPTPRADSDPNYASIAARFPCNGFIGAQLPNDTGPNGLRLLRTGSGAYTDAQSLVNGSSWGGVTSTGFITAPQSTFNSAGQSWTMDFALYMTSIPAASQCVFDCNAPSSNTTGMNFSIEGVTGRLGVYEGRATAVYITSPTGLSANTWNRIRFSYDTTTGLMYFFNNGTLLNSGGTTGIRNDWGSNSDVRILNSMAGNQGFTGFTGRFTFYRGVCLSTSNYQLLPL